MDTTSMTRIVVEAEPGWLRIKDNANKAITKAMETRLASLPGGKEGEASEAVRKEVEARLAKVREEMWKMTSPNLRVNGHNYEDFVHSTEAFDEVLDRRIWEINSERVGWNTTVADLRRQRPAAIQRLEQDLEDRRTHAEWVPDGEEMEEKIKKAEDIPPPLRHAETVGTFVTLVSNLSELASSAPAQLARAQRAQNVREEIATMPL